MKVSDKATNCYTSYYPIHTWTEEEAFTVEEIPVTRWNWDHNNGLGWGIGSVDVGDSSSVFGARMLYRHTGPEVLPDRLRWLHSFLPSRDNDLAEWITRQNQHIHWPNLQVQSMSLNYDVGGMNIRTDSCFVKITEAFADHSKVLFIRCADGYVYETAFTKEMSHA